VKEMSSKNNINSNYKIKYMNKIMVILVVSVVVLLVAGGAYWMFNSNQLPAYNNAPVETQQTPAPAPIVASDSVKVASGTAGQYLTDVSGMTLYYFTKDTNGKSNCTTPACIGLWPAFYTTTLVVSSPLSPVDFSTITGSNGAQQTTYKGQPLYRFANDVKPGDILGNGVGGVWFLVKP
jgi:predicted lipoprotein with Yx(FWY)xxD motif